MSTNDKNILKDQYCFKNISKQIKRTIDETRQYMNKNDQKKKKKKNWNINRATGNIFSKGERIYSITKNSERNGAKEITGFNSAWKV